MVYQCIKFIYFQNTKDYQLGEKSRVSSLKKTMHILTVIKKNTIQTPAS